MKWPGEGSYFQRRYDSDPSFRRKHKLASAVRYRKGKVLGAAAVIWLSCILRGWKVAPAPVRAPWRGTTSRVVAS